MKRGIVIGVAVLVVAAVAGFVGWGLTGSVVAGSVVRERDGKPIQDASVEIDGEEVPIEEGVFSTKISLGDHEVVFTAPGYEDVSQPLKVSIFRKVDVDEVGLRNADVAVKIVENYPGYPEFSGATLQVGERSVETSGAETLIEDVPVGDLEILAMGKGCQEYKDTFTLIAGQNSVVCTVTPTLESVVERSAQNVIDRDYVLTYSMMHPVRQKQWGTQAEYTKIREAQDKENEGMVIVTGFKVLTATKLDSYDDKASKQAFKDVYRVPVSYRISSPLLAIFGESEMPMTLADYWVLVDGQWRCLGDGESVDKE